MNLEGKIEGICINELWHPDLFDDLKLEPTDMNARQALKATASLITRAIADFIRENYIEKQEGVRI